MQINRPNGLSYEGKQAVRCISGLTSNTVCEVTAVLLFAGFVTLDLARCRRLRWCRRGLEWGSEIGPARSRLPGDWFFDGLRRVAHPHAPHRSGQGRLLR